MNYKDRLIKAFPVLSQFLAKQKMFAMPLVTGAVAGDVAVAGVKVGDELISVINITDGLDLTSEFTIRTDGIINNVGGTSTATKKLIVTFMQWQVR